MDAAIEESVFDFPRTRAATLPQVIALLLAVGTLLGLAYPGLSKATPLTVPQGARADWYSQALGACAQRLERSGVDLAGYTMPEQADDIEAGPATSR